MAQKVVKEGTCWYTRGWEDFENQLPMGKGLWAMHQNGESQLERASYKRGWRDAMVCDLCQLDSAPKWLKEELGV